MRGKLRKQSQRFDELLRSIVAWFVATVPDSDAVCEFDCPETNCSRGKWQTCQNRKKPFGQLSLPKSTL
jgi:hypothetical protein